MCPYVGVYVAFKDWQLLGIAGMSYDDWGVSTTIKFLNWSICNTHIAERLNSWTNLDTTYVQYCIFWMDVICM